MCSYIFSTHRQVSLKKILQGTRMVMYLGNLGQRTDYISAFDSSPRLLTINKGYIMNANIYTVYDLKHN